MTSEKAERARNAAVLLDLIEQALQDVDARLPVLDRVRFRHRLAELEGLPHRTSSRHGRNRPTTERNSR